MPSNNYVPSYDLVTCKDFHLWTFVDVYIADQHAMRIDAYHKFKQDRMDWVEANATADYTFYSNALCSVVFGFKSKDDAMLFKLTW